MPIAFSFYSIIVRREALLLRMKKREAIADELYQAVTYLLESKLADDYLIGMESMSSNLEQEKKILSNLGLIWHKDTQAVDYFIPSEGSYLAPWLAYARVQQASSEPRMAAFYSAYRHILDHSDQIVSFDETLNIRFPEKFVILNRNHWGSVAKEEMNRLYQPSWEELLQECTKNNRICPIPLIWNELYQLAIEANCNLHEPPQLPLILGAWWDTSDAAKAARFIQLIQWSAQHQLSDVLWAYLGLLQESEWHHADELN